MNQRLTLSFYNNKDCKGSRIISTLCLDLIEILLQSFYNFSTIHMVWPFIWESLVLRCRRSGLNSQLSQNKHLRLCSNGFPPCSSEFKG